MAQTLVRTPVLDRRSSAALVALVVLVAVGAAGVHIGTGRFWLDLDVYRRAGQAVLHGRSVYDFVSYGEAGNSLRFTYPPFAALLLAVPALLGTNALIFGWTLASTAALAFVVRLVLRRLAAPGTPRPATTLRATLLALPMYPVLSHLLVGQVDLLLMALVLADLLGSRGGRWRGVGIGIAAGIKLTPAIFAVYLLMTGRVREAARALAAFVVTVGIGFLVLPHDSGLFWGGMFLDDNRIAADGRTVNNQSLPGALARLTNQPWPPHVVLLTVGAVVGLAGLGVAIVAARRGDELGGICCAAITGLLITPVSWEHHWVWLVPVVLVLAWRGRMAVAGVLWLVVVSTVSTALLTATGHDAGLTGALAVYADVYPLIGIALLAWAAWRLRPNRVDVTEMMIW